ncbi:MAG: methyltransferase domain-containing protein, partial [Candidatus Diapherotrites archaeon]
MIKTGYELSDSEIANKYSQISDKVRLPMFFYYRVALFLGNLNGKKVLDCGCGNGFLLALLSKKNPSAVLFGIDPVKKFCKNAKNKLGNIAIIKQGSIYKVPFKNNFFDVIIVTEVLEHLKNPIKGLRELSRKIKKNGKIIVTIPNGSAFNATKKIGENTSSKILNYMLLPWEHPKKSIQPIDTLYDYDEILDLFKRSGFRIKRVFGYDYFPYLYNIPKINQIFSILLFPFFILLNYFPLYKYAYSIFFEIEKIDSKME